MSNQRPKAPGEKAYAYLGVHRRSQTRRRARLIEADPVGVQLGVRLTRPAPLAMEELLQIKGCGVFEPIVDRPRQPVGQKGEGFALAMCRLQTRQACLPRWILAQE